MAATARMMDLSRALPPQPRPGRPITSDRPKQIRARARRAHKIMTMDLEALYKPIEDWDAEELARGRPRGPSGKFTGPKPAWISRAIHEQIVRQFELLVRQEMNIHTVTGLNVLRTVLESDQVDHKGKPIVSASTKVDAAKFLVEHVIGKPKQRIETDISVKLQTMLGIAMVNPTDDGGLALTQGYVEAEVVDDTEDRGD